MLPLESPPGCLLVFYDASCPLCCASVRFLLARDRFDRLRFASLHSKKSEGFFNQNRKAVDGNTLLVWNGQGWFQEMEAIGVIFSTLPGIWKGLAVLRHLPKAPGRALYRFVANRRYRWGGRTKTCTLPGADQRHKFVDSL